MARSKGEEQSTIVAAVRRQLAAAAERESKCERAYRDHVARGSHLVEAGRAACVQHGPEGVSWAGIEGAFAAAALAAEERGQWKCRVAQLSLVLAFLGERDATQPPF